MEHERDDVKRPDKEKKPEDERKRESPFELAERREREKKQAAAEEAALKAKMEELAKMEKYLKDTVSAIAEKRNQDIKDISGILDRNAKASQEKQDQLLAAIETLRKRDILWVRLAKVFGVALIASLIGTGIIWYSYTHSQAYRRQAIMLEFLFEKNQPEQGTPSAAEQQKEPEKKKPAPGR